MPRGSLPPRDAMQASEKVFSAMLRCVRESDEPAIPPHKRRRDSATASTASPGDGLNASLLSRKAGGGGYGWIVCQTAPGYLIQPVLSDEQGIIVAAGDKAYSGSIRR